MMRLIFKTSSVTPHFFYVFNLILSFSTCSESFEKICAWELLGANVLKLSMLPHARCVDIFVEGESVRKVAWSVAVSKVRVTGLVISTPSWHFEALSRT